MKIAIIGSGISGMAIGYLLNQSHDITLYEKDHYIGGHSRTISINVNHKNIDVDTGFIVFNKRNYPYLTALFKHLNIDIAKSDMSFGVSIDNGWLEYGTKKLYHLFGQKNNLIRLQYWQMLGDILKFNNHAKALINQYPNATMGEFIEALGMGEWFQRYYLIAMGAAIWSTSYQQMLDFPAQSMINFFDNHGLLTVQDQPQWYTVKGGSRQYIHKLTRSFDDKIRLNCAAVQVTRKDKKVIVTDNKGEKQKYDHVIFACHSDQALSLIDNPNHHEHNILSHIRYHPNRVITHSDINFMPKRRALWASWVYLSNQRKDHEPAVSLSYWMNSLQPLDTNTPIIVTLNPSQQPDPALTYDEHIFAHPVFDHHAITAQQAIDKIQGIDKLWFCGAWQGYGFHEDGLKSAVNIAQKFNISLPW